MPDIGEPRLRKPAPVPVADAAAVVVGAVGYLIGGEADARLASVIAIRVR